MEYDLFSLFYSKMFVICSIFYLNHNKLNDSMIFSVCVCVCACVCVCVCVYTSFALSFSAWNRLFLVI